MWVLHPLNGTTLVVFRQYRNGWSHIWRLIMLLYTYSPFVVFGNCHRNPNCVGEEDLINRDCK